MEDLSVGYTVTFTPLKPLFGPSGIDTAYCEQSFPTASAERLLRARMEREEPANQGSILAALYRKYLIDGPLDEAKKLREEVVAQVSATELRTIENIDLLLPDGWEAYSAGDYEAARLIAERCLLSPERRSIYALTLLAFALLRLDRRSEAESAVEEMLSIEPGFAPGHLFRAEVAITDKRFDDAEAEAWIALRSCPTHESNIQWACEILGRIWGSGSRSKTHADELGKLEPSLAQSPAFLTALARERYRAGQKTEAIATVKRALAISPNHEPAARFLADWTARR
jgi:tetratricopeptide (TPR) repeat protein